MLGVPLNVGMSAAHLSGNCPRNDAEFQIGEWSPCNRYVVEVHNK